MKRDSQRGSVLLAVVLALSLIGAVALLLNRGTTMNLQSSAGRETADVAGAAAEAALNHAVWQAQQSNCVNYVNFSDQPFGSTGYQAAFSPVYTTSITPLFGSPVLVKAKGVLQKSGTTRELSRRVRVYEPSTTVTLQLGTDPGKDTMLDSWYNTRNHGRNYGGVSTSSSQLQHQLYQFDLPDIPSGVTIFSAQLVAYAYYISSSGPAESINLHRVTRDWLEGTKAGGGVADGATWDTYDGVNPWTVPGGDFDPVSLASAPVLTTNQKWFSWSIIPLVSQWLEQPTSNMGVLLKGTGNFWVELASTEYNVAAQRPKLTITYACECGVVCGPPEESCNADYSPNTVQDEFSSSAVGAADVQAITYLPEGIIFNSVAAPAGGAWILIDQVDSRFYMTDPAGTLLTSLAIPISNVHGGVFISSGIYANHLALTNTSGGLVYVDMDGNNVSGTLASGSSQAAGVGFVDTSESGTYDGHVLILDRSSETVLIRTQASTPVSSFSVNDGTAAWVQDVKHLPGTDKVIVTYDPPGKAAIYDFTGTKLREYDLTGFGITLAESTAINPLTCEHVVADRGSDRVVSLNVGAGKVLFVSSSLSPTTQEQLRIDLIKSWGYTVTLIDDDDSPANYDTALADVDVVYIAGSGSSAAVGTKLTAATVGVLSEDIGLVDDLGIAEFLTIKRDSQSINIIDNTHYVTSGFSHGELQLYSYVPQIWTVSGALAPGLQLLGETQDAGNFFPPGLAILETGAELYGGGFAAGRRVQMPWSEGSFDINALNADGQTIMKRALEWGAGAGPGGPGPGSQTATLNPVADTWIYQDEAGGNYGNETLMQAGKDDSSNLLRTMVKFDISSLPAGATVVSATLRLYATSFQGPQNKNVGLYRITADWDENTVTWNSSGGGGFDPASLAEPLVDWSVGWKEWDVPPGLIHEWLDTVTPNYGLLLDYLGAQKKHILTFATRENGTVANHPQLVIEYTEP